MLGFAQTFWNLLEARQRKHLLLLQVLFFFVSLFEILGVSLVAPLLGLLSNPDLIQQRPEIRWFFELMHFESNRSFLLFACWGVLAVIFFGNLVVILSSYVASHFAHAASANFADRLFRAYVAEPFEFHLQNNSSKLAANVQVELTRVNNLVIVPALQLNQKTYAVLIILVGLFVLDPWLTVAVAGILAATYLVIFYFSKRSLVRNGDIIGEAVHERSKMLSEALGGIREAKLFNSERVFIDRFNLANWRLARAQTMHHVVFQTPRNLLEIVAFGGVIFIMMYLTLMKGGLTEALPVLTLYALAGFKLMPAMQQCFQSAGSIKGNIAALENVKDDLFRGRNAQLPKANIHPVSFARLDFENVGFHYQGSTKRVLNGLNLSIKAKEQVAFVGESGSGKSTCIDLILGLLQPQEGRVLVNGRALETDEDLLSWRSTIGFVPQTIFLTDDSIAANIAFGVSSPVRDEERIWKALRLAQLEAFVKGLPRGLETRVGERGVQLSGGQRQRLGIARALYRDPQVLIFDEATSALDGITEKEIVSAIQVLSRDRTIIVVAHRLSTIRNASRILMFDAGSIVDSGTFEELESRNSRFKSMSGLK